MAGQVALYQSEKAKGTPDTDFAKTPGLHQHAIRRLFIKLGWRLKVRSE